MHYMLLLGQVANPCMCACVLTTAQDTQVLSLVCPARKAYPHRCSQAGREDVGWQLGILRKHF